MAIGNRMRDSYWPTSRPPLLGALAIPLAYVVLATVYIHLSGRVASVLSHSAEELAIIESLKGYVFVFVTGIMLYFLSYFWLRRLQNQTTLLVQSER